MYSNDNHLLESLAEMNNSSNQLGWSLLRGVLDDDVRDNLPELILPYKDITVDDIKDILSVRRDAKIQDLRNSSFWSKLWK